jgi:cytochrome c oxidase assembly protein subunit 15
MTTDRDRSVRRWLYVCAGAVVLTVMVGGITRLTESGLSITEWRPVSGVLPPLTSAEWRDAYQRYLAIPEAQTVHRGITLAQFQRLFVWEWVHRLLARLVGLILALPYFVLLAKGRMRARLRARLVLLPVLAAAEGAMGWYMVKSGLAARVDVSAYRLTAHLALALTIYLIAVWTALDLQPAAADVAPAPPRLRHGLVCGAALTFATLLSGAFVAGLDGGKIYNTFPLMGGQVVPPGYRIFASWWQDAMENPAAAQFHHRLLGITTAVVLLLLARAARGAPAPAGLRHAAWVMAVAVIIQVALGIATLLLAVPVPLGVLHQLTGVGVLTAAVVAAHRARGAVVEGATA